MCYFLEVLAFVQLSISVFTGGRVIWMTFLDTLLLCVNATICLSGSGNLITVPKKGYL
jgi:hypothetical protein